MSAYKILASIIALDVAVMCDTETMTSWAIIGIISGLRKQTLMSEVLLLAEL